MTPHRAWRRAKRQEMRREERRQIVSLMRSMLGIGGDGKLPPFVAYSERVLTPAELASNRDAIAQYYGIVW